MSENSKYREMFVQEALEHVESLNQHLLKFEEEPNVKEHVDVLFRSAHTIKGMAATMGYDQIRKICITIEEIFDKFRKGEETITPELGNVIFYGIDILKQLIHDETKKIDLEEFLHCVKNPSELKQNNDESDTTLALQVKSPTVRVRMQDLDALVNLVGEMMISKMRLEQIMHMHDSDDGREILMTLGRLITDIQYQTMKIRLVPIDQVFNRFSRMIRDVSTSLGKEVKLEVEDSGIELDRTVLDAITDPLLHMLRNAVDHGLETPSIRREKGKPETGIIRLSANRLGDRVEIQVEDDGNGIDLEAIKSKALEKQIVTSEDLAHMSDEEIVGLVGTPGLSTAKAVTDISGRGVGMDVVMTQVKNVGGQVKIVTEKGRGTSILLTIPMSLAIIGGLLVNISDQKYILPLSSISTTITINKNEIKNVHGHEMIILRDKVVPIIRVSEILGLVSTVDEKNSQVNIVVVDKDGKSYGLIVDSLEREQEVVIKRLTGLSNSVNAFSDATILPDGKVALILEPSLLV
ncbi:MAG: chemotaxis protein CheA [Thaumarchaeota archaeon]|nr:chemotaxis protein CheA [Nitrososphaerota archaeon]MDE1876797.1 chemotaxis protein CheA [Nitrososphaerota archaeon]